MSGSRARTLYLELGGHREFLGCDRPVVVVGRNPACDVVIDRDQVSRFHARFEYRGGRFFLRDESRNGTYVWFDGDESPLMVHHAELELTGRAGRVSFRANFDISGEQLRFSPGMTQGRREPTTRPAGEVGAVVSEGGEETRSFGVHRASAGVRRQMLEITLAYQLLESCTDQIVALLSSEGFIIYYNQHLENLTKRPYREFVGQDFFSFVHPDDRQKLLDALVGLDCSNYQEVVATVRLCTAEPRWASFALRLSVASADLRALGLSGILVVGAKQDIPSQSSEGLLVGRYELLNCLSVGNFCHTYLAVDRQRPSQPRCIVKRLSLTHPDPKFMQVARRLFYQEALSLERLGVHDRIPLLLAYLEDKEYFYIIQEFIEGEGLDKLLGSPWSVLDTLNLMRQILGILHYVHRYDVIHRDIKPANIIRRAFDGNYVLIDFGSVKLLPAAVWSESQVPHSPLTIGVGTPGYVAPEQLLGQPTKSSDIYSVGIIAIEALLGCSYESVKLNWQEQLLAQEVDSDLIRILARMTETDVERRYASVSDVFLELNYLSVMEIPSLFTNEH